MDIWNDRWKGRREQMREPPNADGGYGSLVKKMKESWGDRRQWNTWDSARFANGKIAFEVTSKEGTWNHGYLKGGKRQVHTLNGEVNVSVPLLVRSIDGPKVQFETEAKLKLKVG